jgi:hypothetical protein
MNDNNNERVMGIKKLVNDYGHPIPFYCLGYNKLLDSISKQDREDGMMRLLFFVVKSVGCSRITFTFIF